MLLAFQLLRAFFLAFPEVPAFLFEVLVVDAVLADVCIILEYMEIIALFCCHGTVMVDKGYLNFSQAIIVMIKKFGRKTDRINGVLRCLRWAKGIVVAR